ncbi:MAG TPA: hypothetical protein VKV95_23800 [Terriglobia bacterium]|nr:hypothetical protein [Terriglobia bacterium]
MNPLIPLVWTAGAVQLVMVGANAMVPKKFHYRENLARLSPVVRQVFVVHSIYIVLVLLSFCAVCFLFAPRLVGHDPLGRSLSAFLAFFWLLRIALQIFYYDGEFRRQHRLADVAYTLACCFLAGVFAVAAVDIFV